MPSGLAQQELTENVGDQFVYLRRKKQPVIIDEDVTEPVSDQREVTETVHYKYTDGLQAAADHITTLTFSRSGQRDADSNITWDAWSIDQTFAEVDSPVIAGYKASEDKIAALTVSATDSDVEYTVWYSAVSNSNVKLPPEVPGEDKVEIVAPKPVDVVETEVTDEIDEVEKVNEEKPTSELQIKSVKFFQAPQLKVKKTTRRQALQTSAKTVHRQQQQTELPQTGEKSTKTAAIIGSILLGMESILAASISKRKKD